MVYDFQRHEEIIHNNSFANCSSLDRSGEERLGAANSSFGNEGLRTWG